MVTIGLLVLYPGSIAYAADLDLEVNTGITYASNVVRAATAPEDDICITMAPKIALEVPFSKLYLSSSSRVALEQHVSQTDENLQEVVLSGLARYDPSDHLCFGLQDDLAISGRLRSAEEFTDVTRYREFVDNKLSSSSRYEWRQGILAASLGYGNTIRNYAYTEKDDWVAHSGQLQVECLFGHKTSTQLRFGLMKKVYEANVDYINIPVVAYLKRKLGNRLEASFSLGVENRVYNRPYEARNLRKLVAILEIERGLTPRTTSKVRLHYKTYDSDSATGYALVSKAGDVRLVLDLRHRDQLILEGFYTKNDYMQLKRRDNFFEGYAQIRHRFVEWGDVVLAYGYEKRTSSLSGGGYQQHVIDLYYIALF